MRELNRLEIEFQHSTIVIHFTQLTDFVHQNERRSE